jgi:hypothetical protein
MKKCLVVLVLFSAKVVGQRIDTLPVAERILVPIFTNPFLPENQNWNIKFYNYYPKQNRFDTYHHPQSTLVFKKYTFYVSKTRKDSVSNEEHSLEYFRLGKNKWREITSNKKESFYKDLLITNEIILRDTGIVFNPETYDDFLLITEYLDVKELHITSATHQQGQVHEQ